MHVYMPFYSVFLVIVYMFSTALISYLTCKLHAFSKRLTFFITHGLAVWYCMPF